MEGLDESSIWTASRLVTGPASDGGRSRVPTLQIRDPVTKAVLQEAVDNKSKSRMFFDAFFPPKPNISTVDPDFEYPVLARDFMGITDKQIHRTIQKMKPYKATRSHTVPNSVFTHGCDLLVPYLGPLFRATDTLKVYPMDWKLIETPVLRKPGKPNYALPGAWHPIVLSNSYAWLLNGCKTERMLHWPTDPHRLLRSPQESSGVCEEYQESARSLQGVFRSLQGVFRSLQGLLRSLQGVLRSLQGLCKDSSGVLHSNTYYSLQTV